MVVVVVTQVTHIENILSVRDAQPWTKRWLEVLKGELRTKAAGE